MENPACGIAASAPQTLVLVGCSRRKLTTPGMLPASGVAGFYNRATHNLWVLLREVEEVRARLADGSYAAWYAGYLGNSVYLPPIRQAVVYAAGDT